MIQYALLARSSSGSCDAFSVGLAVHFDTTAASFQSTEATRYTLLQYADDPNRLTQPAVEVANGNTNDFFQCIGCGSYLFLVTSGLNYKGTVSASLNGTVILHEQTFDTATSATFQVDLDTCSPAPTEAPVASCGSGFRQARVVIDPDDKPYETSWAVVALSSGSVVAAGGVGSGLVEGVNTSLIDDIESVGGGRICLECDANYVFSIADTGGDGICCNEGYGEYFVQLEHQVLHMGGKFTFGEQFFFNVESCSG